jgi:hypothetical protein
VQRHIRFRPRDEIGIFLTPVFYYIIQWFADRRLAAAAEAAETDTV